MCSVPSGVTTQPGVPRFSTATDRPASGPVPARPPRRRPRIPPRPRTAFSGVAGVHHGVRQVRGQRADRRGQLAGPGARHDQHRQVAGPAHVGVRAERVRPVPRGGHPQPRRPGTRVQPGRQRLGVPGPGGGQHLGGERVHLGAADRDPDVGQVGVRVDRAVPGSVGLAARRGHARRGQCDEQFPERVTQPVRQQQGRRPRPPRSPGSARYGLRCDPRRGAQPEPLMGGVVQGVPMVRRVHVHDPERPADHGRRRLVYRQAARHVGRETDPEQPVVPACTRPRWCGTRPAPAFSHSTVCWVTSSPSSVKEATSREPIGHRSCRTRSPRPTPNPSPGPLGDRCQGPSPCLGCCAYSSWITSSLPGPASTLARVRLSVHAHRPAARRIGGDHVEPRSRWCSRPGTRLRATRRSTRSTVRQVPAGRSGTRARARRGRAR